MLTPKGQAYIQGPRILLGLSTRVNVALCPQISIAIASQPIEMRRRGRRVNEDVEKGYMIMILPCS